MDDRKNVLFQPGMSADSWGVFALSLQLQEVSINSDVGLPEGGLPPSLACVLSAWLLSQSPLKSSLAPLSPTQRNYCFV